MPKAKGIPGCTEEDAQYSPAKKGQSEYLEKGQV